MTLPTHEALKAEIEAALAAGITDESLEKFRKTITDATEEIEDALLWSVKDNLAATLSSYVVEYAQRSVEALLAGNAAEMDRYLHCDKRGFNGRSDGYGTGDHHPIIHGTLFEQGPVALRKQIVEAHRDLLVNERILDLEDQVRSLVAQVNKAHTERDRMFDRVRVAEER